MDLLRALGLDAMREAYLAVQIWGTPEMCIEKIQHRREVLGDFDLTCCFRYASLPYADAERSMRTFAAGVMAPLRARRAYERHGWISTRTSGPSATAWVTSRGSARRRGRILARPLSPLTSAGRGGYIAAMRFLIGNTRV